MEKPALVIMAAGMGSRYGGLKQIDPVDGWGHLIIDFSIYDAIRAGFCKIIFIIKKDIEKDFRELIGDRMAQYVETAYAYQELNKLPDGFRVPDGRKKPWGTAHAILCCRHLIDGPFAVINADDFYGRNAFHMMYDFLSRPQREDKYHFAMIGYQLANTITEAGHVARGICAIDKNGYLADIHERTRIEKREGGISYTEDNGQTWTALAPETTVSMNLWGFSEGIFKEIDARFSGFLETALKENPLKCEYFLPAVVDELLKEGKADIRVLPSGDKWYGMTYHEDKQLVMEAVRSLKDAGVYPDALWGMEGIISQFSFEGRLRSYKPYGDGHINDTYYIQTVESPEKSNGYILQKINSHVFKKPRQVMDNIGEVTAFLRQRIMENGGNPERETLEIIKTVDGKNCFQDDNGCYWRAYRFITDAVCLNKVRTPRDFYESAYSFGRFQYLLRDFPAQKLYETIPDFHNTPKRYLEFQKAVENDRAGRVSLARQEIRFVEDRREFMDTLMKLSREGRLPLRVTHNDTKLNNIMLDRDTGRGLCVIDLDTVMPGLVVNDFGDSIRFGASTASEDETDLSLVALDIDLFTVYTEGFLDGCDGMLTKDELSLLVTGAKMMTLECGMRFLTDYLNGDVYFKVHSENQNLYRARTQFKLVEDMEEHWIRLEEIVKQTAQKWKDKKGV